ncbi:MAG: nucleotidyltransferase family protein [Nitrososphaeria archaeon]
MKAFILAGGLGTRLRSLVSDRPKPMADVNGRPFLHYVIELLKRQGINDIVLSVGYMAESIVSYFGDGSRLGVRITYSYEERPLGTGGALKRAEKLLRDEGRFLVLNGDTYILADFRKMLYDAERLNALVYLLVKRGERAQKSGVIQLDESSRVVSIRESESASGYFYAGASVVSSRIFELMPEEESFSFEYDLLPRVLHHGVYALIFDGYIRDIGTPEGYMSFLREVRQVAGEE